MITWSFISFLRTFRQINFIWLIWLNLREFLLRKTIIIYIFEIIKQIRGQIFLFLLLFFLLSFLRGILLLPIWILLLLQCLHSPLILFIFLLLLVPSLLHSLFITSREWHKDDLLSISLTYHILWVNISLRVCEGIPL